MIALVLIERQVGEAVERLLVAGPERVDQARDEDGGEVDQAALLGEVQFPSLPQRLWACWAWELCCCAADVHSKYPRYSGGS